MGEVDARTYAGERAEGLIRLYRSHTRWARFTYRLLQVTTLVSAGVTPILVLVGGVPKLYQAIPPAVAAFAAGLVTGLDLPGTASRDEVTATRMTGELWRFRTQTGVYADNEHALEEFVNAIESIELSATLDWQTTLLEGERAARAQGEESVA